MHSTDDDIVFRVSDGDLLSDKVHLPVRILPSSSLTVTVNKPFHAVIGSRTTLSRDTLDIRSNIQGPIEIRVVSGEFIFLVTYISETEMKTV